MDVARDDEDRLASRHTGPSSDAGGEVAPEALAPTATVPGSDLLAFVV